MLWDQNIQKVRKIFQTVLDFINRIESQSDESIDNPDFDVAMKDITSVKEIQDIITNTSMTNAQKDAVINVSKISAFPDPSAYIIAEYNKIVSSDIAGASRTATGEGGNNTRIPVGVPCSRGGICASLR